MISLIKLGSKLATETSVIRKWYIGLLSVGQIWHKATYTLRLDSSYIKLFIYNWEAILVQEKVYKAQGRL